MGITVPTTHPRPVSSQEAIKWPRKLWDRASLGWRNRRRRSEAARRYPTPARPRPRRPGGGYVTSEPASGRLRAPHLARILPAAHLPRSRVLACPPVRSRVRPPNWRPLSQPRRAARSEQRVTAAQPAFAAAAADLPLSHSGKRDRARCARPRRPPLVATNLHLHTRGAGLRVPHTHWPRCPSLSLHKTHMELHVPRVGSSMKTRRSLAPLLVLPSGPFHFRPRCLPFKTARVPSSGSAEWRVPPRDGGRKQAPLQLVPAGWPASPR